MTQYVRLTKSLADKGILIRPEDIDKHINSERDYYVSTYYYNDAHFKQFKETGTVKGIKDVTTNKLWFDFDNRDNPAIAQTDAKELVSRLKASGVQEKDIEVYFSGNKGLNVLVTLNKSLTPVQVADVALNKFGKGLNTLDPTLYDAPQILRVPGTKHPKTGLYKIPLTVKQLNDLPFDNIKSMAKSLDNINESFEWAPVTLPDELFVLSKKEVVKKVDKSSMDLSDCPRHWKIWKWALAKGYFESGERHHALMIVAATCRSLGYTDEQAYYMCKAALKAQSSRTGTDDFPKEELWNDIIQGSVYSDSWEGGSYSPKNDPWLAKYCERMGFEVDKADDIQLTQLDDIKEEFIDYVHNIDANTILTGIPRLDKAMPLTIGMGLGLIGAASSGKCLGKDTPVRMHNGSLKMVQDVKVGDLLMGDDSTPRKVLSTCTGREKLYKVKQSNGDDYVVNASHILSLITTENSGNYQRGDKIDMNIEEYISKSDSFKRKFYGYKVGVEYLAQELPVDPYYLGLWLGDGSSYGTYLSTKDKEVEEYSQQYAMELGLKHIVAVDKRTGVRNVKIVCVRGKNNILRHKMRAMGLMKTFNDRIPRKHIPDIYLINSRENRMKLLAGLIDSDGHSKNDYTSFNIVQKSKELSDDILELVRSLGFKATMTEVSKSATNGSKIPATYYSIYFSTNTYDELIRYIRLDRKKPTNGIKKAANTAKLSFEDLGVGDYFGFEIDGNHRFLLGDFTVTHNTALILKILKNTSKAGVFSVFASLDMRRNRLYEKLLYQVSGLNRDELYELIREGKADWIFNKIKEDYGNVYFYDRSCPTVDDIRDYIVKIQEDTGHEIKLVALDYFERVNAERSDDTAASKEVAGKLQDLVSDLNICLITLVQPNKFALNGGPDTPILNYTSIKGSSFLYQSFRSIISIWRPFFNPATKNDDKFLQMAILKNDLGELDMFNFGWNGKRGEIWELGEEQEDILQTLLEEKANKANNKEEWE